MKIATWRRAWTMETAMETTTETDAAALTTTSVIERAIERVADALGASTRTFVVVFVTCAVGAVVARMMMMTTTTTTRARDDASPMGANDRYRDARARALERREEALREASVSSRLLNRDERDEAAVAKRLAEIDAKAARLGVGARGRGQRLGGGTGSSSGRPEWNPLMGGLESRGYRPSPRARPGGGG